MHPSCLAVIAPGCWSSVFILQQSWDTAVGVCLTVADVFIAVGKKSAFLIPICDFVLRSIYRRHVKMVVSQSKFSIPWSFADQEQSQHKVLQLKVKVKLLVLFLKFLKLKIGPGFWAGGEVLVVVSLLTENNAQKNIQRSLARAVWSDYMSDVSAQGEAVFVDLFL